MFHHDFMYVYRDYQKTIKEHALSIFYTINQENTEIFLRGRNLRSRTGKGPKPLGAELEKGGNLWQPEGGGENADAHL